MHRRDRSVSGRRRSVLPPARALPRGHARRGVRVVARRAGVAGARRARTPSDSVEWEGVADRKRIHRGRARRQRSRLLVRQRTTGHRDAHRPFRHRRHADHGRPVRRLRRCRRLRERRVLARCRRNLARGCAALATRALAAFGRGPLGDPLVRSLVAARSRRACHPRQRLGGGSLLPMGETPPAGRGGVGVRCTRPVVPVGRERVGMDRRFLRALQRISPRAVP